MPISDLLENKTGKERANIKGQELAKIGLVPRQNVKFSGADYDIEIVSMKAIDGGVEVLARAWDSQGQIGFGKDGLVDIERFTIINPPIMVADGTKHTFVHDNGREVLIDNFKEDLQEAILQSLAHTIGVIEKGKPRGNIIPGKVGNTTLTAYPNASTGTAPIDSELAQSETSVVWATLQGGAGNLNQNVVATVSIWNLRATATTDQFSLLRRGGFGFDTDTIGTDNIDSAIFSIYVTVKGTALGDTDCDIVDFNPAAGTITTFDVTDYANFGTTRFATGKTISSGITTSAYNDFTLNASGVANINKTGNSYFGTRLKWDIDNSAPTWVNGAETNVDGSMADTADTTQDPKLVVEHSAAATYLSRRMMSGLG